MYANGGNYDSINISVDSSNSGVSFKDWNGGGLSEFMNVGTLAGAVEFKRNVGVTGSIDVTGGFSVNGVPFTGGTNGTSGTDGANGTSGTSGLGFTWSYGWNSGTTYNTNEVVSYNGSSYVSNTDNNTGNQPDLGGSWSLMAQAGANGTSGTDGTSGTSGESGTSGTDGASGTSGIDGTSGTSGVDGVAGTSGTSGESGTSGTSGLTTGQFPFTGSAIISGSLTVNGPINVLTGSLSGSVITNVTDIYTNVPPVNNVVTLTSASYASLQTAGQLDSNTLYIISASNISAGTSGTSGTSGVSGTSGTSGINGTNGVTTIVSSSYTGSFGITGSLVITGSAEMNVVTLSIVSNTASIDLNAGNYFTGSLSGSVFFNVTNVRPGETAIVKLTTTGIPTASFSSNVRQVSGSAYVATSGSNWTDILTFVSMDATNVFLVNTKKFI
jgi:hypothetical protein